MPTIFDVAKAANVSIASVSLVLRDPNTRRVGQKKREDILRIAKQTGYVPNLLARGLSNHGTGILGLVIPVRDPRISFNPTIADMLAGIQSKLLECDYHLIVYSHKSEKGAITNSQIIRSKATDGLIFINTRMCTGDDVRASIKEMNAARIPFVMINSAQETGGINYVGVDDIELCVEAAAYLHAKGHRKIGMLTGTRNSPTSGILRRSFEEGLKRVGLSLREAWFGYTDFQPLATKRELRRILRQKKRPTALFCTSDQFVPAIYEALREDGVRIPEDLSILGRGNLSFTPYFTPPLTTMSVPIFDIGRRAATLLIESLKSPGREPQRVLLPGNLVERDSVAAVDNN